MGNCISANEDDNTSTLSVKEGITYAYKRKEIRPLDLIMFQGGDFVSDFIRFFENRLLPETSSAKYKIRNDLFSHVGLVVNSDILDDDRLDSKKLYIFESTMSGDLTDGVKNIDGKVHFGVQLRDLDEVMKEYDANPKTRIAVCHLQQNVRNKLFTEKEVRKEFTTLFDKYDGVQYDANLLSLVSTGFKCIRPLRGGVEDAFDTEDWLFCSELIAEIFRELEIFDKDVNTKNVVPMDFLGFDQDTLCEGGIPVVVEEPIYVVHRGI